MASNIIKRGTIWYFTATIRGKRYLTSLKTEDKSIAARVARTMKRSIMDGGAEEWLESGRVKKTVPSLQALMEAYKEAPLVMIGLKRERTRKVNLNALKHVLALAGIPATEPINALNEMAVGRFEAAALKKGLKPVSVRSYLGQAACMTSGKICRYYRKIGLAVDGEGVRLATNVKAPRRGKRLPPVHVRDGILVHLRALRDQPEQLAVYAVYLLCYGLGMRACEAAFARLTWFYPDDQGILCVHIIARPAEGFDPKGTERSVPLDNDLMAEIIRIASPEVSGFVIPGTSRRARMDAPERALPPVMQAAGWHGPKYSHELRAWRGSEWWTQAGPQWAKKWLGHASIATTESYYADVTSNGTAIASGAV